MQFNERLKKLRKQRGLTQEELAQNLHVSRSAIAKWENGLGIPSDNYIDEIATFFGITRDELLSDRETETIIVEKNTKLSRQKKWLTGLIALVTALIVTTVILLCVFIPRQDEEINLGAGEVEILGISAAFDAQHEELDGDERLSVYHLKVGQTYAFIVNLQHRGSKDARLYKSSVDIYYNPYLFTFGEGEYLKEPDRDYTPTDGYPFYFTCLGSTGYTEIFVVAAGYWCSVSVIIEN